MTRFSKFATQYIELILFCEHNGVGFEILYLEACGEMQVSIVSSSKEECYFEKRILDFESFINNAIKKTKLRKVNDTICKP